ncbi:cadherin domain-containing protein [Chondrinema litorale]|uniref:cadherin domain-containing protein n=1 Tax=Chondrinema litorale TaxID=2994555 RepID=UPI002543836A|nr:cadherin domain-containing protein [Chondrinema litorale]UZR99434.1 cadherin domain-containing protein [Chondrinema litorale]
MKSPINLINITLVILLFSNLSKAQMSCGTVSPTPEQLMSLRLKSTSAEDLEALIDKENITYIALKIFLIRTSSGTSVTQLQDIEHDVKATNWYFSRVNIQFYIDNVTYIDDDQFYDFSAEQEYLLRNAYADNNTINVFFPNEIYKNGVEVGGYAYLPPGPKVVFVSSDNTLYSDNTLAHEIGHFFDLYHTHGATDNGTTSELVDGSNCDVAGDMVCDTPADPNLDQLVDGNCEYAGNLIDANGQSYQPDVKNIMSYSNGGCMKYFSEGQFARMLQGFYDKRSTIKYHKENIDDEIIQIENNYTVVNEVGTKSDIVIFEDPISDDFEGIAVTLFDDGDKLKVDFDIAEAGSYEISVRLRSGNAESGNAYWPDSYLFTVDNEAVELIGDETTISSIYATFGGSYWGEMRGTKNSLEVGSHFLTIEGNSSWGAVDYIRVRKVAEPVNNAPTDIILSNSSIKENEPIGTEIGTLSTTDADAGDSFTYSLPEGEGDNSSFSISGNKLLTAAKFDYEGKTSYSVVIETKDAAGEAFEKTFTISITDEVENTAPTNIGLSKSSVKENEPIGTEVGTLSTTDADVGDSFTYSLPEGEGDNSSFSISGNKLLTAAKFDYEGKTSYSVVIETKDAAGEAFEKTFTISITDEPENSAPTNIGLSKSSVKENEPIGTEVGTLSTTDADVGDSFTYSLPEGEGDNSSFSISGNKLLTAAKFDYEGKTSYSVVIETKDAAGEAFEKTFTISITDEPENSAPTNIGLSKSSVKENEPIGTEVGTLSTTDADVGDSFTYSLPEGEGDNSSFSISGNKLLTAAKFDYEGKTSYSVVIETKDAAGEAFEKTFTISITDEPENSAPTNIGLSNSSIKENEPIGTEIGTLSTTDADSGDSFTYSLPEGEGDNSSFSISGNKLLTAAKFDYEGKTSYSVVIETKDAAGEAFEKAFTISITDEVENTAPTNISLSKSSVKENQPIGTEVGILSTTDADSGDSFTYSFVSGTGDTDNASFSIDGSKLKTATELNYETKDSYSVRIQTKDSGGKTYVKVFTVTITDESEDSAPSNITLSNLSIKENQAVGTEVGSFSTTDSDIGDTHTYNLVSGTGDTDNSSFSIDGSKLKTTEAFDYETKSSYSIRVRTTDTNDKIFEKSFTISITDETENSPPTSISISSSNISETAEIGSIVGSLSTSDPDLGDIHTYTLVSNWDDNTAFTLEGSLVKTAITFNYDTQNRYYIKVKSDDGNGGSTEAIFVISIINEAGNSAPSGIILNTNSIAEHGGTGDVISILKAVDVDRDDAHVFSLVEGTGSDDNGAFYISNDTLYANQSFDYEVKNTYSIRVKVVDADSGSYEEVIEIYIADIAENFRLAGNIIDHTNAEVEEGIIALYNKQNYELVSELNLGSSSSFEFTGLDTGNYILKYSPDIKFEALGVPTYSGNALIMSEASIINLNSDVTDYTINLLEKTAALTGEETISGTAYKTDENAGGRTNEEVILSGVPVYLLDFQTEEILSNTTSDEDGNFTFHQVNAGNYLIKSDYQVSVVEKELNKIPVENGDDSVKIKLSINDTKTWTEVLYVTATDNYQELQGVTFFPNPFGDVLNYEIDNEYIGELELRVLDLSGRLIKNENIQKQQLNYADQLTLPDLSKGMYLIRIQSDNLSKNLRVIKR